MYYKCIFMNICIYNASKLYSHKYLENRNNLIDQNTFFLMVHMIQYFYVFMSQNFVSKERGGYTKNDSMFTDLK